MYSTIRIYKTNIYHNDITNLITNHIHHISTRYKFNKQDRLIKIHHCIRIHESSTEPKYFSSKHNAFFHHILIITSKNIFALYFDVKKSHTHWHWFMCTSCQESFIINTPMHHLDKTWRSHRLFLRNFISFTRFLMTKYLIIERDKQMLLKKFLKARKLS